MTVYDVHKYLMGNTTIRTTGIWEVYIKGVNKREDTVTASWNGNPPKTYSRGIWSKWRLKKPVMVTSAMGYQRIATREEQKVMKTDGL
jgi:hypothetical protein